MANLSQTYCDLGKLVQAEALALEALRTSKECLSETHPDTLKNMSGLASVYWYQGRFQESEQLAAQVLRLRKDLYGERHPETLESMTHLAVTWLDQGRKEEAYALLRYVLDTREAARKNPSLRTIFKETGTPQVLNKKGEKPRAFTKAMQGISWFFRPFVNWQYYS